MPDEQIIKTLGLWVAGGLVYLGKGWLANLTMLSPFYWHPGEETHGGLRMMYGAAGVVLALAGTLNLVMLFTGDS